MDKKEIASIASKKYYQKNKDKIKERMKNYYETNKEKIISTWKNEYYKKNAHKIQKQRKLNGLYKKGIINDKNVNDTVKIERNITVTL
jgi:hypothetical protein